MCQPLLHTSVCRIKDRVESLNPIRYNSNRVNLKPLGMKFFSRDESYISKDMTFYGDLDTDTDISVYGTVYGNIKSKRNVTLGASAHVEGNVESDTVAVCGNFKGVINAKRLIEVKIPANITGDLIADSVRLAPGVAINGKIRAKKAEVSSQMETPTKEGAVGNVVAECVALND